MAVVNTGLLTKGLRSEFFNRFESTPAHHKELATRIPSTSDSETYRWLGTVPKLRQWGTGRVAKGLRAESYSVENLKYEATIEVDRDEISDDQTGQIRVRVGELAQRAATHKDYLISQLLISGGTAGFTSYDGVAFFNDAHVSGSSGSQDNNLTSDVVDPNDPTVPEFKTALKQAMSTMMSFNDDQGEPLPIAASGLVCVVPPTMFFTALESINATLINNTTNVLSGAAKVISMPWLTDASMWYLLKTDGVLRPFIFQDREPIQFDAIAEGSELEFNKGIHRYGTRARYRLTYGEWRHCIKLTFST